jgi:hypothetical protein
MAVTTTDIKSLSKPPQVDVESAVATKGPGGSLEAGVQRLEPGNAMPTPRHP